MERKRSALVLLSGGVDSTVTTAIALQQVGKASALFFSYRQRNYRELDAAARVAEHYEIALETVSLPRIFGESSPILNPALGFEDMSYYELMQEESPSPNTIPFRNGVFLSIAAAIAERDGHSFIYIGSYCQDILGFSFYDTTPEFIGAMGAAVYVGTGNRVRISAPLTWMRKVEVIKLGYSLKAPFHLTWSCFDNLDKACGRCQTCTERYYAFQEAGLEDPIEYLEIPRRT